MSIFSRIFGSSPSGSPAAVQDYTIPSNLTAPEFGKVIARRTDTELQVQITILMEPQGQESEGWQTGVALDASASMKDGFGRMLEGKVPPDVTKKYEKKGWLTSRTEDGRRVKSFQKEAYEDAINNGYLTFTSNKVEPIAREFMAYLAGNLDADGGTTVIYWACGDGSEIEVLGDVTEQQCHTLDIQGPISHGFGDTTVLTPAVRYFTERFVDAERGMYIFITDGKIDDLPDVKRYTTQLARDIASGKRSAVKCVLIGVGDEIDEAQMEELDDLDTGTNVDIWDHKVAKEMRALIEIFAEVVDENLIIAPTGILYDSAGQIIRKYTDGLPAKMLISMPASTEWFELEVAGRRIRQTVRIP